MTQIKTFFIIIFFFLFYDVSYSQDVEESTPTTKVQKKVKEIKYGKIDKVKEKPYIKINFKRKDTSVEIFLDPYMIDTYLDLEWEEKGAKESGKEETEDVEKETGEKISKILKQIQQPQEDISSEVLNHIHNAQKNFYDKNFTIALEEVNLAQKLSETAVGYALKGSILYKTGNIDAAIYNWQKALELNPQMTEIKEILLLQGVK